MVQLNSAMMICYILDRNFCKILKIPILIQNQLCLVYLTDEGDSGFNGYARN
jgi:hypothetical protein